jgi:hypothetical protein
MAITITRRPYNYNFSGNPIHYELYSPLAEGDPTVFFEVKLMFKKMSQLTFFDIVTLPYSPVVGRADIDLKEIINSLLEWAIPGYNPSEETFWDAGSQSGYFYLQFREITESNPDPTWDDSEKDFERFVLKGGLNDFKYQGNNFWLNYYFPNAPFLTWQQNGRMAAYEERMYLTFLDITGVPAADLRLKISAYYTDGSNDYRLKDGFTVPRSGCVYHLPSGAFQWDINNWNPTKTIHYWTIQVGKDDPLALSIPFAPLSEVFTYELDNRNDEIKKTIHYRNSLGGIDSLRILGSLSRKAEYEFTELQTTIEPDYFNGSAFSPQKRIIGNSEQIVYTGNIGQAGREEIERLRDAQMIRETWMRVGNKWVPLCIITKSIDLAGSDTQRFHMPIEFTLGYTGSEYFTPDSANFGDGVFTENVCFAMLSPLSLVVDNSGVDSAITINGTEIDPQNASTQFRYRVIRDSDGVVVNDWLTKNYADLPLLINFPKDTGTYKIESQAICTNSVFGSKVTAGFDTDGAGAGTGIPGGNSQLKNFTGLVTTAQLDNIDTVTAILPIVTLGAVNTYSFNYAINGLHPHLRLTLGSLSPAYAALISDGVAHTGILSGNIVDFYNVTINGGFIIHVF